MAAPTPLSGIFTCDAAITLTPFTCAEFGATEEHALRFAMGATVADIDTTDIAPNATCADVNASATVAFTVAVPAVGSGMGSGGAFATAMGASLEAVMASGTLTAELQANAMAMGADWGLVSASVSGVTVATQAPTLSPTWAPTPDQDDKSGLVSLLRVNFVPIAVTGCAVFFLSSVALVRYKTSSAGAGKMKETGTTSISLDIDYPGAESFAVSSVENPLALN